MTLLTFIGALAATALAALISSAIVTHYRWQEQQDRRAAVMLKARNRDQKPRHYSTLKRS